MLKYIIFILPLGLLSQSINSKSEVLTFSHGLNKERFTQGNTVEIDGLVFDLERSLLSEVKDSSHKFSEEMDCTRWLSLDQLAEKYPSISPYNFCNNNPILYIDIDGRDFIVKNKADRDKVKAAIGLVFGGTDAFSFNKRGKLSIDATKLQVLDDDQKFILENFQKGIVDNEKIKFEVSLTETGKTSVTPVKNDKDYIIKAKVNINISQPDFEEKLNDTENGLLKNNDPNYKASDLEKYALTVFHEVGHVIEDQKDSKSGSPENNKKAVGFENVVRRILKLNERVGKKHGVKNEDGTYKEEHQGHEEPSKK